MMLLHYQAVELRCCFLGDAADQTDVFMVQLFQRSFITVKMSEAHLRMLVEKILVHEEDGRLDLEIRLKAPLRDHLDVFENGAQTDCFPSADFDYDRLGAAIYGDYYAG